MTMTIKSCILVWYWLINCRHNGGDLCQSMCLINKHSSLQRSRDTKVTEVCKSKIRKRIEIVIKKESRFKMPYYKMTSAIIWIDYDILLRPKLDHMGGGGGIYNQTKLEVVWDVMTGNNSLHIWLLLCGLARDEQRWNQSLYWSVFIDYMRATWRQWNEPAQWNDPKMRNK